MEIKENSYSYIYPFNEKYFTAFYEEGTKAIIKLYNINSMKYEQNFEFHATINDNNFFPISNTEYMIDNNIVTISWA